MNRPPSHEPRPHAPASSARQADTERPDTLAAIQTVLAKANAAPALLSPEQAVEALSRLMEAAGYGVRSDLGMPAALAERFFKDD